MATTMSASESLLDTPKFRVSKKCREAAAKALKCSNISTKCRSLCDGIVNSSSESSEISTHQIRELHETLQKSGHKIFLHELVEGSDLILPAWKPKPRDPELEKRVQKMRIEQENKEYRRMTKNVDSQARGKMKLSFNQEVKSLNRQLVEIGNFLITVIAGFAFGYKGVEIAFGKIFPMQMLCGLIIGTIVFFVDLYFLMKYGLLSMKTEDSQAKD